MSNKIQNTERSRAIPRYYIYCVNIFGSGLNTIKDEFKRQVRTCLRQAVYFLDLDEIQVELNNLPRNTELRKDLKENANNNLINAILQQIQEFRKDYEMLTTKLKEELKFDLYQYWLKEENKTRKTELRKNIKQTKESTETKELRGKYKIACSSNLIAKEHNRLGKSMILNKRKYIKDEPVLDKLYIIILGRMNKIFYTDLLSLDQPLEGIINFIPTESNYEILLGNNKLRNFIMTTLEAIKYTIYEMRQEEVLKSVGLFTLELPVISKHLATTYSREVFDQLTWSIYDIDMLRQQYENFYLKPFQLIDVEIKSSDNLIELYHVAETMAMKGHFADSLLPGSDADFATVAIYLNCLLNRCALPIDPMKTFWSKVPNSFSTITNISKYQRLVVSENNKFLLNMLQYADFDNLHSIYLCCWDYDIIAQYVTSYHQPKVTLRPAHAGSLTLPQYVKYYANKDCTCQRITELLKAYDEYERKQFAVGYNLYTFKRKYYVLTESEGSVIIPTRLCFRDFTLHHMEEFLRGLQATGHDSTFHTDQDDNKKAGGTNDFNENIFTRPNSLKAIKMPQEERSENNENKKRDSRPSRSRDGKKSINGIADNQGLPADHHLLKGYNLGDTLQEVKHKTSKYYFHHGFVKLYEEKWHFQDMNKQLSLAVQNTTLFLSRPRHQLKGISNSIRLITKNNISIQMLSDLEEKESPKAVINYPNGLSISLYDNYSQQVWFSEKTPSDEQSRKFTPFGAIIVSFKSPPDMIMILRYNGEVYRLYQHDPAEEMEEQDINKSNDDMGRMKGSQMEDFTSQGDSLLAHVKPKTKKTPRQRKLSRHQSQQVRNEEEKSSVETKSNLMALLDNELKFLNFLCHIYNLTYLGVVVTTSQGRCISLTLQGEIFEKPQSFINEWQDYSANEAYCERSDGVKMIWSQDSFKCFHNDGTVFTTTVEDDLTEADDGHDDEFESQISQSSSHMQFSEEAQYSTSSIDQQELDLYTSERHTTLGKLNSTFNSIHTINETLGENKATVMPFLRIRCTSWLMQHQNYAKVFSRHIPKRANLDFSQMEIYGSDNIRICIQQQENTQQYFEDHDDLQSGNEEYGIEDKLKKERLAVNVWIDGNLHVTTDNKSCNISCLLPISNYSGDEMKSHPLNLSLKYTKDITDAFKYLINEIASIVCKNTDQTMSEELHFIEKTNKDCSIRGFEFFNVLPITSNYNLQVGNTIAEIKPVNSINEPLLCNCEQHKRDLLKFPRFKENKRENTEDEDPVNDFPRFLSANIFIQIPKQLLNLKNITKFLEPFEDMHFKRFRGKFMNIFSLYLEPQQEIYLKILTSKNNWKKRHLQNEKRIFTENQRLGLYNAMNKHKTYPNYWKYTQHYGGMVKQIEDFDFMQSHCWKKGQDQN